MQTGTHTNRHTYRQFVVVAAFWVLGIMKREDPSKNEVQFFFSITKTVPLYSKSKSNPPTPQIKTLSTKLVTIETDFIYFSKLR